MPVIARTKVDLEHTFIMNVAKTREYPIICRSFLLQTTGTFMEKIFTALVASLLFWLSSQAFAADPDLEQRREIRTDCQTEGKAVGFAGSDLDEFIEECVEEFISAELFNVVE